MPLELKIVGQHAHLAGDDAVRVFRDSGGTIGRSLRSDWILPDPNRFISSQHATIDFQSGAYYLADTSSNGVYINKEAKPLGKGDPRRLYDGDRLRMGEFEIEVSVDTGESLIVPMEDEASLSSDHLEQFVDEDVLQSGMQFLDEEELADKEELRSVQPGNSSDKPEEDQESLLNMVVRNVGKKSTDEPVAVTEEDLFDSFLDGLGISRVELDPSINRSEVLVTAGQVLREFVKGTTDLLASRANLKNTFRLDQTTILPRQNNPMKFSVNTSDLLKQLLIGSDGEYLGAQDSIGEVCRDLIHHQNAFLDAMNSAFTEFADLFEPEELQERFDQTIGKNLFGLMDKAKYWDLYCELYPIITEKGGGRFPQKFAEEFVKAYEKQITEYRRHDDEGTGIHKRPEMLEQPVDEDLIRTRTFNAPIMSEETAFEDDDIVDALSKTGLNQIDPGFIEDLEKSLADDDPQDSIES